MASELELEIQQHLSSYLDGRLERYELEDWLIPTLWDLAESDDDAARELAGRIENLISENSRGDRSPESLREELTRIARPFALGLALVVVPDLRETRTIASASFRVIAGSGQWPIAGSTASVYGRSDMTKAAARETAFTRPEALSLTA